MTGEFTQENRVRLKHEEEKEQSRLDEWKVMAWVYVHIIILWQIVTVILMVVRNNSETVYCR